MHDTYPRVIPHPDLRLILQLFHQCEPFCALCTQATADTQPHIWHSTVYRVYHTLFMVMQVTSRRSVYQIDFSRLLTTRLLSFATDMAKTSVAASVPLWICLLAAATPEVVLQVQPYPIMYLMSPQHLCTLAKINLTGLQLLLLLLLLLLYAM